MCVCVCVLPLVNYTILYCGIKSHQKIYHRGMQTLFMSDFLIDYQFFPPPTTITTFSFLYVTKIY